MREHDNLAALIDDAGALADQFCSSLPGAGGAADLNAESPVVTKAQAYRDLLFCRFADQAFSAARSARHGRPVSTSSLTRSAFETFTHLFELRDHLESAFSKGSLDALDGLLTTRLFGDGAGEAEDFSLDLDAEEEEEPEAEAEPMLPVADNDADDDDHEFGGVDPGASVQDTRADLALRRLMQTLIAIQTSFDNCYRALEEPMRRLDEMFGPRLQARSQGAA
ncbi:MAG: hypothetical protein J7494_11160 [Sphingobium sp.]|nr:hypothetical protein [Sphingobium sp.]